MVLTRCRFAITPRARTSSRRRDEANRLYRACATRETRGRAVGRTPGPRHARAVVSRRAARRLALTTFGLKFSSVSSLLFSLFSSPLSPSPRARAAFPSLSLPSVCVFLFGADRSLTLFLPLGRRERLGRRGGFVRLRELFKLCEHGVYILERLVYILATLAAGQHNLPRNED